ncbi:hypothetical protein DYB38_007440 [Aphanomyces astaci]|uniref:EH domain-containing protein n=2 Tax=Aphanomyces astaci TaxID=112090 RepID=A0A397DUP0_APHAT|nr:hypothetical protein DYB38_007440 [Aphanomyces astaci]
MWEKSKDEEAFYARMFQLADVDKTGKVEGKRAVEFFTKSGLPATILKQVWSLASTNMQPYLNQDEFNVALGLIALAQRGDPLELARLDALGKSHLLPLPVLHTISGVAMSKDFVMAASDEAKYKTLFRDAVGGDITISVAAAMDLFQKSGLSLPELHDIYRLVDHGRSTSTPLPVTSFTIAMHLIVCKTRRGMSALPTSIPMELFPTLELPPIALDHLGAQNKLVEALARVPIPSSSPQSTLDIHLDAVEALGYVLPSRHTTAIADGAALSELESVLLRYIAQVTQELLELQDSKPTSAVVPVQTLLQTLANLKQQSTRLVEQKEAALRRLHPPTLHIDTNQDGVGRPSCFDSTFDHDGNNIR